MPVQRGRDSEGTFYRWGDRGKKYYYTPGDKIDREAAKARAARQGKAINTRRRHRPRLP